MATGSVVRTRRALFPTRLVILRTLLPLAAVLALLTVLPTTARAQEYEELPPELEAQAHDIYDSLMCPQCQGQTIGQSRAPIAKAMRERVRERLLDGDRPEQVIAHLVEAFGEAVLASPPTRGLSLLVWVIPPVAVLLGAAAVALAIRGLRRGGAEAAGGPQGRPTRDLGPYLDMVDREIQGSGSEPSRGG